MNHVLCDGGLCNRLNALLFALILHRRYGHEWTVSWPRNNWCRASFDSLFSAPLPVDERSIEDFKARQSGHRLLMHENQLGFDAARFVPNRSLTSWADYERHLASGESIVYFNNLLPPFVEPGDVRDALSLLSLNPKVEATARRFVDEQRIDGSVVGLHIRKTDFGDLVDDGALWREAAQGGRRYFVCSDSPEVNERFAALPNCAVFPKTSFPQKMHGEAGWLHQVKDTAGRPFGFNVDRPADAVAEALVDLLVLSRTETRSTSHSTFLATARLFRSCGFFAPGSSPRTPPQKAAPMNAPLEARKFNLAEVDENEHLIPRPYGTLQTLNLDHLYRYAFAKGFCFGADVLDAAMGCGYASLLLNCKSYTGVDIDPNMVAFANEVYLPMTKTGRYVQGSVLALPVADKSIDTFISFETIEHIQPHEVGQYFAEAKRVLRPGGRFICSTPVYRGDRFGLLTKYHPFEFRFQQFEATLLAQGFTILDTLYQWPPHFTLEHVMPSFAQTQQAAPFLTVCVCQLPG